jgi:hypothetical protein
VTDDVAEKATSRNHNSELDFINLLMSVFQKSVPIGTKHALQRKTKEWFRRDFKKSVTYIQKQANGDSLHDCLIDRLQ